MDNSKENLILQQQSSIPSFLTKTYDILEVQCCSNIQNSNYSDIIQWNEEGQAFIIKKPYEFAKKILPKYFKHNNYTSFIRQLNIYDFHKIKNELGKHVFRHNFFQKEKKHLLCEIKRKSIEQQEQLEENNQNQTNNSQLSMSKLKNDYQQFHNEILRVKAQQQVFQQTIAKFMTQNDYLINQNSLLWQEIYKIRDIDDKKIENFSYLLTTLIVTINQYSQSSLLPSQQSSYYQTSSSDISISQQNYQSNYLDQSISLSQQSNQRLMQQTGLRQPQLLFSNKQDISIFDQGFTKKNQNSVKFDAYSNGLAFYQKLMDLQQQQKLQEMQEGQNKFLMKQRK
ncbi:unnamed protein product (macronuclear) [Paramecium tetraurelia]|uniref:HSF-type DNA-binding domain-containing protein n=1 Tax=Paramecium tetraurelia TaxID=5888 RepID=A0BML7_PARTE|nr:uncharacterized protein GSPATT00030420001 [Paramecium tetraurelia]CAK59784.1 unnamed protein product [Paramecium tetraurelia]|eukprot:XP_001427182.1 hypothetical protein (macronuclear) [Paramecium tetraurelia strain d4-2]